jgi:hypothetical protein
MKLYLFITTVITGLVTVSCASGFSNRNQATRTIIVRDHTTKNVTTRHTIDNKTGMVDRSKIFHEDGEVVTINYEYSGDNKHISTYSSDLDNRSVNQEQTIASVKHYDENGKLLKITRETTSSRTLTSELEEVEVYYENGNPSGIILVDSYDNLTTKADVIH